jgi:hypothetical protein
MENPETVGILRTQDTDKHNTTQKTKEMNNPNPTTNPGGNPGIHEV